MAGAEDTQAQMFAAINLLTAAVEKQPLHVESLHTNQASTSSVLEALQMLLGAFQESITKHRVDVAAQLTASPERFQARQTLSAQVPPTSQSAHP